MHPVMWIVLVSVPVVITVLVIRVRPLRNQPSARKADVAVIIPARNEAHQIGALLANLRSQTLIPAEILVLDDGSEDATSTVAAAGGARVSPISPTENVRPAGWNPKVWALTVGVDQTDAGHLVFLDADTRMHPHALASLLAADPQRTSLVSVAPHHVPSGLVESFSAACNVIVAAGGGPGLGRNARGAVGSCISISRSNYEAIGGHRAQPATIVDDLELAAAAHRARLPVRLLRGADLIRMRSYPEGGRAILEGWTKNFAAGLGHSSIFASVAIALWITVLVMPLALLGQGEVVPAVVLWLLAGIHLAFLVSRVGDFPLLATTLLAPFHGLFITFITVASLVKRLRNAPVTWKGRALGNSGLEYEQL